MLYMQHLYAPVSSKICQGATGTIVTFLQGSNVTGYRSVAIMSKSSNFQGRWNIARIKRAVSFVAIGSFLRDLFAKNQGSGGPSNPCISARFYAFFLRRTVPTKSGKMNKCSIHLLNQSFGKNCVAVACKLACYNCPRVVLLLTPYLGWIVTDELTFSDNNFDPKNKLFRKCFNSILKTKHHSFWK